MDESSDTNPLRLTASSAAAVDAIFEARQDGLKIVSAPPESSSPARLLALLDTPGIKADESLADATMARILRFGEAGVTLSQADAEALDAYVAQGYDVTRVSSALKPRAERHAALQRAIAHGPAVNASALADRVLDRVRSTDAVKADPYSIDAARASRRWRWRDALSVAAMLALASAVMLPMLDSLRRESTRTFCRSNLGLIGRGMGQYASNNRDALPMVTAGFTGGSWWDVGKSPKRSNSANLFSLVRGKYVQLDDLACPGNPFATRGLPEPNAADWHRLEEVSYSYQIMASPSGSRWKGSGSIPVILADRSPVVLAAAQRRWADPMDNTPNHGGRGQHLLLSDGSVGWFVTPLLPNGDNIWLPRPVEHKLDELRRMHNIPLNGVEAPASADDVFLGP